MNRLGELVDDTMTDERLARIAESDRARRQFRWLAIGVVWTTGAGILFGTGLAVVVVIAGWCIAIVRMRLDVPRRPPLPAAGREPTAGAWPSLDRIKASLSWASTSRRAYDHGARRTLQRVCAARLEEAAGVRLWAPEDRQRAQRLLGPQLWALVDPDARLASDSTSAGVDGRTVDSLLDRLDSIAPEHRHDR